MRNSIFNGILIVMMSIFFVSCTNEKEKIDLQPFKEKGIITNQKIVFFTHLITKKNDLGVLHFTKQFYENGLKKYNNITEIAIVFLVDCDEADNTSVKDFFLDWGYADKLVIQNVENSSLFKDSHREQITAISYILKSNGEIVSCTNPSLGNAFHSKIQELIK